MELNKNITIISEQPIKNTKASETYISVRFVYSNDFWEGFVPIEYRRTGTYISFENKDDLYTFLNDLYMQMEPSQVKKWKESQNNFWITRPNAGTTKAFFDKLSNFKKLSDCGWKCGSCEMPRNPNPQRRIQDLKEFGYTIATDLSRYCPHCKKNTSQRLLLPIKRAVLSCNGYETWSPMLRARIIKVLNGIDVYENTPNRNCLPDHKFSEIRWDEETKEENLDTMSDTEIKKKFQLLTNQRNQQKREVCRTCFQTGKRGIIFGIPFFYQGNEHWNNNIPKRGKLAEKGCVGCPWYDIEEWRKELLKSLGVTND